jgi:hypothetical protein
MQSESVMREKTIAIPSDKLNAFSDVIALLDIKFGIREEYVIEYLEQILDQYISF